MLGIAIRAWHSDTCVLNQTVGATTELSVSGGGVRGGVHGGGNGHVFFIGLGSGTSKM